MKKNVTALTVFSVWAVGALLLLLFIPSFGNLAQNIIADMGAGILWTIILLAAVFTANVYSMIRDATKVQIIENETGDITFRKRNSR